MTQRRARPPKHENVPTLVREHIDAGKYLDTRHAFDRMVERRITLPEVLYVLRHGYHEKRKTVDRRELRVCMSFDDNGMLIITTIDLDASNTN